MTDLLYAAVWAAVMLPFLLFVLYYGLTKPRLWIREPIGRSLMILAGSLVALTMLAFVRRAVGDGWAYEFLFWPAIIGIQIGGWYLFRNLRHLQRQAARVRRERDYAEAFELRN